MNLQYEYLFGFRVGAFKSIDSLANFSTKSPGIYISVNAESLYQENSDFLRLVNANYGYSDGIGAVISSHINGTGQLVKLPGCELWLSVLGKVPSAKVAFVGGDEVVINLLVSKISAQFPLLDIVYYRNGFFDDESAVISSLSECKPEYLFVGMGQPKQELFCEAVQCVLPNVKFFPIGGSFDLYVGKVNRAPSFMIKFGLEWLYRLYLEPGRWRRQLVLPKFLLKCLLSKVTTIPKAKV
ncbi:MAG: WecB/TagA/CpsF family glycosyltransferase [Shewanella algae]|uniref:WecB/TagA/CpsF family glycosyltransferase n=1 Tax=Shewanella algae TaxID=38313 RepID=UPI0031F54BB4